MGGNMLSESSAMELVISYDIYKGKGKKNLLDDCAISTLPNRKASSNNILSSSLMPEYMSERTNDPQI